MELNNKYNEIKLRYLNAKIDYICGGGGTLTIYTNIQM